VGFALFLSSADATRVRRVLDKLTRHGLRGFALTESLAMETHFNALGHRREPRRLNDVDIVVDCRFDTIPRFLAESFLFAHAHPNVPAGRMFIQAVDSEERLRIDIFRAFGGQVVRSQRFDFGKELLQVVSLEDLAARSGALVMDLERGQAVASKHATDFLQLAEVIDADKSEAAWRDHRKQSDPATFEEASARIRKLVEMRPDLLVIREYSTNVNETCPTCEKTGSFRLASRAIILSVLGHC
jgi:hypothetical protein